MTTSLLRRLTEVVSEERLTASRPPTTESAEPPEPPVETVQVEAEVLDHFASDVDARSDVRYVQLIVQRSSPATITLTVHGGSADLPVLDGEYDAPDLALGEMAMVTGETAEDIYAYMLEWSRVNPGIGDWLDAVRVRIGDASLRLLIWDDTGLEIPWELYALYGDEDAGVASGWLGGLVAVTRKVTVHPDRRDAPTPTIEDQVARGAVLACIEESMARDSAAIGRFRHERVSGEDLVPSLLLPGDPVAMLYVACHGHYESSMTSLRLGGIRLSDLGRVRMPPLEATPGLVFLNACHSGRMVRDRRLGSSLFGFAEAFLRRGAAVVIGATGEVETGLACRVAGVILGELGADPDLPVSVALRDARAQVAGRVPVRGASPEQIKELVYAFMFVCYGNPFARVVLPLAEVPDA